MINYTRPCINQWSNALFSLFLLRFTRSSTAGKHTFQDQTPPASPFPMMAWLSLHVEVIQRCLSSKPHSQLLHKLHSSAAQTIAFFLGPMLDGWFKAMIFKQICTLTLPECVNKQGPSLTQYRRLTRDLYTETFLFLLMCSSREVCKAKKNNSL